MGDLEAVAAAADAIEGSMRTLGLWSAEPPPPERMDFRAAFGADTLAFVEWIQWVLMPRVRAGLADGGKSLPGRSEVSVYAARELDGQPEAQPLVDALRALDAAVNR